MSVPYRKVGPVDTKETPDTFKLKGKNVLVTGGSSGLGAAYVQAFIDAGAYVTNADIREPVDYTPSTDGKYQYSKCDVSSFQQQVATFKAALKLSPTGTLDIVIANAGITGLDPIYTLADTPEPEEPDLEIINVDLVGAMYTAKCAMHYWQFDARPAEDKCFIIKSSMAGYVDLPAATSYQMAKYGVRGMMVNLRIAGRMRVNLVAPWFVKTAIQSAATIASATTKMQAIGSDWAEIGDCVEAMLRLACDESINGKALGIVPRRDVKEGFVDLEWDEYPEGSKLAKWLDQSRQFSHRTLPKEKQ